MDCLLTVRSVPRGIRHHAKSTKMLQHGPNPKEPKKDKKQDKKKEKAKEKEKATGRHSCELACPRRVRFARTCELRKRKTGERHRLEHGSCCPSGGRGSRDMQQARRTEVVAEVATEVEVRYQALRFYTGAVREVMENCRYLCVEAVTAKEDVLAVPHSERRARKRVRCTFKCG